jgi:pyruvate dehydrogenase (quinone)
MGGSYQQEVDLQSLYKDVASEYLVEVNVPEQLPNAIDRAFRTALSRRAPTAVIVPSDLQTEAYSPPEHAFKQVPSSAPGLAAPTVVPDRAEIARAAEVLNAGRKVAVLVGQGARGAASEVEQIADVLGAGVAKALLGKDVLSDELPFVTGAIGLLGTRPSYELMRDRGGGLRFGSQLVRPPAAHPRRYPRLAVRHAGHHGTRRAVCDRREVRPPGPPGDRPHR